MNENKLWTKNFVIITLINFCMFFAFQLFPTALPPYLKALGATDGIVGWLQGVLTLATIMIRPFAGVILDRRGRKVIFIVGLIGMLLVTTTYWVFTSIAVIVLLRFLHGFVWGISNTACSTIASDNIERHRFGEGMGYFSLAASIALATAPALALYMGLKRDVLIALCFLIVSIVLTFFISHPKKINKEERKKIKIEPYAKEALIPSIIMFFFMLTYGSTVSFLALYGAEKSIGNVGLFFTVYAISLLITRPFLGRMIDKKGYGIGIWPAVILIPITFVLLFAGNSMLTFILCAAFYGAGLGAAQSSLQTMAILKVSHKKTGAANATFFTFFDGGIGMGSILAGILSGIFGYGGMYLCMAIFPVVAGIIYFIYSKYEKEKLSDDSNKNK